MLELIVAARKGGRCTNQKRRGYRWDNRDGLGEVIKLARQP
jgi:hypothetical protein